MPAWSPDGALIAFVSARHADWDLGTACDIYTIEARGGAPVRVTATDGACLLPVWSPEGDRIAHVFIPGEFDDPRHGRIAIVDARPAAAPS